MSGDGQIFRRSETGRNLHTFPKGSMLGSDFQAAAHDGASMLSVLLQHGVSLETIRHALTRNDDGTASSLTGAIVDRLSSGTSGQQKL
jgi:ribonucleoside-diphosphate reductase alpha chain